MAVTYEYDAFGTMLAETGSATIPLPMQGISTIRKPGFRYYDSTTARFLTEDTYTGQYNDPLSLNWYTYCHNNPIKYYDPSGHYIKEVEDKNGNKKYVDILDGLQKMFQYSK